MQKISVFVSALLIGCASNLDYIKAYDSSNPPSSISRISGGVITVYGKSMKVTFEAVDDNAISTGLQTLRHEGFWNIEIPSGHHSIRTCVEMSGRLARFNAALDTKPGINYKFSPTFNTKNELILGWSEESIQQK